MKKGSVEQYRNNITLHLARISGDIEHIKEKVNDNNEHLEKINGRLRAAENDITAVKTVGGTITFIIGVVLAWLGIDK
jgi:peptidoglycan hydrolase CwlO-like protein